MDQLHADRVADVEAVLAFTTRPSTAGRSMRTQVPFGEAPVTIASKRPPTRGASSDATADLRTCR